MSMGTIKPVVTAEDVQALPNAALQLQARAALAAGYTVDVRHVRYEHMIFANNKHFYPLSNWGQCVRLVVDTDSNVEVHPFGVAVRTPDATGGLNFDQRAATTDHEFYTQMCDAVVTNVAKGFEV